MPHELHVHGNTNMETMIRIQFGNTIYLFLLTLPHRSKPIALRWSAFNTFAGYWEDVEYAISSGIRAT